MMNLTTYRATPGLDRFPEHERFAVWREAHRRLMDEDPAYRQQYRAYVARIVTAAVLVSAAGLPIFLGVAATVFFHFPGYVGVLGVLAGIVCTVLMVVYICRLAFRQQDLMNRRVAAVLPPPPAG